MPERILSGSYIERYWGEILKTEQCLEGKIVEVIDQSIDEPRRT